MPRMVYVLALAVALALLTACGQATGPALPNSDNFATLTVALNTTAENELAIDLGITNAGNPLPADDSFDGIWRLTAADGALRAAGEVFDLPALEDGRSSFVQWEGQVDPGDYRVVWGAPGYGYTIVDFTVERGSGDRLLVGRQSISFSDTDPNPEAGPSGGDQ